MLLRESSGESKREQAKPISTIEMRDVFNYCILNFLNVEDLVVLCSVSTHFNHYITAYVQPTTDSEIPADVRPSLILLLEQIQEQIVDDENILHAEKSETAPTNFPLTKLSSESKADHVQLGKSQIDLLMADLEQSLTTLIL